MTALAHRNDLVAELAEAMYLNVMQETRDYWPHFDCLPEAAQRNWLNDARGVLARVDRKTTRSGTDRGARA